MVAVEQKLRSVKLEIVWVLCCELGRMQWTELSNARSGTLICYEIRSGRSKASGVAATKRNRFQERAAIGL